MPYSCSKCKFTANFESALKMHKQLHHDISGCSNDGTPKSTKKFYTIPKESQKEQVFPIKPKRSLRSLTRSPSATRLLDKIRMRLCKSKLFSHPEEATEEQNFIDSENTHYKYPSKILEVKPEAVVKEAPSTEKPNESFGCHLCSLVADRITVLDRHLLNDHKIGMDNLLKLVMDKTRDGLTDDNSRQNYEQRKSYYKLSDEIMNTGHTKMFKEAASNTDLKWTDIHLDESTNALKEIEDIFDVSGNENREVFEKMRTLNEYMSRFLTSSKTLNKVLSKELSHKDLSRPNDRGLRMGLGDQEPRTRLDEGFGGDKQRFEDNPYFYE
ncbi:uncharacterized protein LOC121739628 [Aricia agestis]|uniref:uncharacterized protein LOC121739628 n=1 Tax=Aricia agestis TaxID=91739 RepID=UPI001C201715|nr:uncharacterized protein LOC121739628 [Aricia agestis]